MNKQFLRFTFSLLIYLTLPLITAAQVVDIPDPNLRAAIENRLGKALGDPISVDEMATLTGFAARNSNISDITGLEHAINLKWLGLDGANVGGTWNNSNSISNLSPLEGLTHLAQLWMGGNSISDLSPLVGLTNLTSLTLEANRISDLSSLVANTGLGSGDEIDVRGNPLNYASIKSHIPTLKSRGVTVKFDDVIHLNFDEPRIVRLVYFLPSDRSPQQDIDTKIDTLIRDVQQFYADEMKRHGFGRKTFTFQTDVNGKAVVYHVEGKFTDSHYRQDTFHKVWEEIREQFYTPQNIYFIAIDLGNERVGLWHNEVCGVGDSHGASSGYVLIPASGDCFNLKTAAHELGHAFGLHHDFRSDTYIMSFGRNPDKLSECTAEWLDAHRYFNTGQSQSHFDNPTKIEMLPPLISPPYAIGFRFEVTDPDGVHQAQLLTPATVRKQDWGQLKFLSCKQLNGETDTIEIEFIISQLTVDSREITLSVIDVYGNITSQTYPIDITTILPTETVSILDKNQTINIPEPIPPSLAIREAFELDLFYQQWVDVKGFPVVASEKVNPYALKEAAWQIWQMIGHRPDVLQAFVQKRLRFSVIARNELITDIPEYSDYGPDFLTYWARGAGGSGGLAVSSSEENLLHYPQGGGSYNVLIHEFAHSIHLNGLNTIDPTFDNRLKIAYDAAMAKGLWQGTYASANSWEYWAEATQAWFHPKGGGSFNNYGNTRRALKAYDPGIAALLTEAYGDSEWRYTSPTERTHLPHLQGFDPKDSPTFQGWPELEELWHQQLRNPNSDGGGRWVDMRAYDPSLLPSLIESRTFVLHTPVVLVNLSQADVLLYWVGYDGTEEFWARMPPGNIRVTFPTVSGIWLIKDLNDKNLAVFQTVEKIGRILIDETLNLITPGLSKVSGDNQTSISGASLANPFVVEVRDENGSPLVGIPVTFAVTAGGGTLNTTRATTDKNGAAQSTLTLGQNPGTNTVSVSAAGIEGTVSFNAVVEAAADIPDSNLRAAIETALGKAEGTPITPSEMATLTHLEAKNANISDLTGLEHATNLTTLNLYGDRVEGRLINSNSVSDISPVAGLTNLTSLDLGYNSISDISLVAGLTHLTYLGLWGNNISDISPVVGLTDLTRLLLENNNISDISPVADLTQLDLLYLGGNSITDISPVAGLTKLTNLDLSGNNISDISPVAGLTNLINLGLGKNSIKDLSPLTDLTELTGLYIGINPASDLSPLAGLTNLEHLFLDANGISNLSPLAGLTKLIRLALNGNSISDLSALRGLTNLSWMRLAENKISDLSPLVANTGLGSEDEINVKGNPLSYLSIHTHIPTLQNRGVTVEFDNRPYPALLKISGDNQKGEALTSLSQPFVVEAQDENGSPLVGIPVTFAITTGGGTLSITITRTDRNGRAQSTLTLGPNLGKNTVQVFAFGIAVPATFHAFSDTESPSIAADVNRDGSVNILDLVVIALELGNAGIDPAVDVNGDGVVNILDLILVAGMFDGAAAAPSAQPQVPETLTAVEVQGWLTNARALEVRNPIMKRGFIVLEQLLISLTPKETELLANYPNPFNPETWIPYRLAEDAFVTLTIYDTAGQVVRTLEVGHRIASAYENRSKAIYWDGRNDVGEQVASGVYFYTLSAGEYSATRRMLIIK